MTRFVRAADATAAIAAVRAPGRRIVTFAGFSGAGYEDPRAVERAIAAELERFEPDEATVCAGATADGIGAVYPIASRSGFETVGIVSAVAQTEGAAFSPFVDTIYVIDDDVWGGARDGVLSPTSRAMVGAADEFVVIGGGDIARDEVAAARSLGKPVAYIPADMNHAAAARAAARSGEPVPIEFKGPLDALFRAPRQPR